jgi:hypothetical protein
MPWFYFFNPTLGEYTLFEENKREACARNVFGAGICFQQGWQATVREQMRGKGVDKDNDQESDQKPIKKGAGCCHIKMIFLVEIVYLSGKLLKSLSVSLHFGA